MAESSYTYANKNDVQQPFTYFPEGWNVKGIDSSIPFRPQEMATATMELEEFLAELDKVKGRDVAMILVVAYHNLEMARKMLEETTGELRRQ